MLKSLLMMYLKSFKRVDYMVTYSDILKAINRELKLNVPIIGITSKDIEEGFERPSFFVEFENIKDSELTTAYRNKTLRVVIYYFAADRYKNRLEIYNMIDTLNEIYLSEPLKINDSMVINIIEAESIVEKGVLQYLFDIELIEQIPFDDTLPEIEEIDVEISKS